MDCNWSDNPCTIILPIWLLRSFSSLLSSVSFSFSWSCLTMSSSVSMMLRSSSSCRSPSSSSSSLLLLMSLKISRSSSCGTKLEENFTQGKYSYKRQSDLWDHSPEEPWPLCPEVPGEDSKLDRDKLLSGSFVSSSAITSHPDHMVKVHISIIPFHPLSFVNRPFCCLLYHCSADLHKFIRDSWHFFSVMLSLTDSSCQGAPFN